MQSTDTGPESPLLTATEQHALKVCGELFGMLSQIAADGPTRGQDLADLGQHVHAIQRTIMAQAAARAYPAQYRLLGGPPPAPEPSAP